MWPFTRNRTASQTPSPAATDSGHIQQGLFDGQSQQDVLLSIHQRLAGIESLLLPNTDADVTSVDGHGITLTDIHTRVRRIETLLEALRGTSPTDRVIQDATYEALLMVYRMLRDNKELRPTTPRLEMAGPEGNIFIPIDPKFQWELLLTHPLQPQLYAARLVLHSTYTHVEKLPTLPHGAQRYSLHVEVRKAPPGFAQALALLHDECYPCLHLGRRDQIDSPEGKRYSLQYWPCVENKDFQKQPFPDDLRLYFDTAPEGQPTFYDVPPSTDPMPGSVKVSEVKG